jgi:hypothetical protein
MLGLKYPRVLQLVPDSVVGQERSPLLVPNRVNSARRKHANAVSHLPGSSLTVFPLTLDTYRSVPKAP